MNARLTRHERAKRAVERAQRRLEAARGAWKKDSHAGTLLAWHDARDAFRKAGRELRRARAEGSVQP